MPAQPENPVLVEITRADQVESQHRGAIAVVGVDGKLVRSWGDIDRFAHPRSSLKPFQAIPLIESGAFQAYGLSMPDLALCCGSHNAEPKHLKRLAEWLERLGLGEQHLFCGPQRPAWSLLDVSGAKEAPGASLLANNCSGKHIGFLTTAIHLGISTADYCDLDHPVQRLVKEVVTEFTDHVPSESQTSVDGCGAPAYSFPLRSFALAMARLGRPEKTGGQRTAAAQLVVSAMTAHPWYVAGTGRPDTTLMQDSGFPGIAKGGAEGFFALSIPGKGLGIAIKIDDGAYRATSVAASAVLGQLGVLDREAMSRLKAIANPRIRSLGGIQVGEIRPCLQTFS